MPLNVVYVDDEPALCEAFQDNFEHCDIVITTFSDPEKALTFINQSIPDLVFLDYRLPNTTGDVLARKIPSSVVKVLITGDITIKNINLFAKIFPKPFDFAEMEAFICSVKPKDSLDT